MAGKAKPTKHTAKEIAMKHHAAKMRAGGTGGGLDGKAKRTAPKEGKKDVFIKCEKCFLMMPSLKSMQIHYESKHPKENWTEAEKLYNKDASLESTGNKPIEQLIEENYENYEDEEEVDNENLPEEEEKEIHKD
jgi:hypothetical protein